MRERSLFGLVSYGIIAFWLVVFALLPTLMVMGASLLVRDEAHFVAFSFSLESYARIFDPLYYGIFVDSLILAFWTTLLCLLFGYPFASILASASKKWKSLLLIGVVIPFWTSSLIRTYALMAILKTKGLLNSALLGLGIISEPMEILYTQSAVFIGMVYALLPFMVLPLYASLEKLDRRYLEAGADLGANGVQRFFRITLPLTMPGVIAGSMLVFLPALGMFYIPDMLGGAKELIIGSFIRNQFLTFRDWPFGAAASMLLTFLMLLMLAAYAYSQKLSAQKGAA